MSQISKPVFILLAQESKVEQLVDFCTENLHWLKEAHVWVQPEYRTLFRSTKLPIEVFPEEKMAAWILAASMCALTPVSGVLVFVDSTSFSKGLASHENAVLSMCIERGIFVGFGGTGQVALALKVYEYHEAMAAKRAPVEAAEPVPMDERPEWVDPVWNDAAQSHSTEPLSELPKVSGQDPVASSTEAQSTSSFGFEEGLRGNLTGNSVAFDPFVSNTEKKVLQNDTPNKETDSPVVNIDVVAADGVEGGVSHQTNDWMNVSAGGEGLPKNSEEFINHAPSESSMVAVATTKKGRQSAVKVAQLFQVKNGAPQLPVVDWTESSALGVVGESEVKSPKSPPSHVRAPVAGLIHKSAVAVAVAVAAEYGPLSQGGSSGSNQKDFKDAQVSDGGSIGKSGDHSSPNGEVGSAIKKIVKKPVKTPARRSSKKSKKNR